MLPLLFFFGKDANTLTAALKLKSISNMVQWQQLEENQVVKVIK